MKYFDEGNYLLPSHTAHLETPPAAAIIDAVTIVEWAKTAAAGALIIVWEAAERWVPRGPWEADLFFFLKRQLLDFSFAI